jgi:TRAP transporter 4TM/12TM fusion protein
MAMDEEIPARESLGLAGKVADILAIVLPLGTIAWAADLFRAFGWLFYPEQFYAAMLGIGIALVYLHVPAGKSRNRSAPIPWYDIAAAAAGFAAALFVALRFPTLSVDATRPMEGLIAGFVLIPLLLEGARRTVGLPVTIVATAFLIIGVTAHLLPGELQGRRVRLDALVYYLTWNPTSILGAPLHIVTTIVIAFVFFGESLFRSGGSKFFTEAAMVLMGRFRGGPAKIAIIASSLFGTISGSVVANVVSTGVVTIPLMKRAGYRGPVSGAIEAVASTGGQLMPPVMGVAAFIMAEFLEVSYASVALAATIPAILFYAALFIQADLEAGRHGIDRVQAELIPRAWTVFRAGWFFPIPFGILIGGIFWLNLPLEQAALYSAVAVIVSGIVLGYKGERLSPWSLVDVTRRTGRNVCDIIMIAPLAGIVIGVLNATGLGFTLALTLVALAGGSLLVLLAMTGVVNIILGMGMPTVGVYILLATLVAPALVQAGIDPMAAHMFILYYGMLSMITPPVCVGAFAAATISGADPMQTGYSAMRFGWSAFIIPFLFVFSPTLLAKGDLLHIGIDLASALAGVWLVSAALTGYSIRVLPILNRAIFAMAGIALMLPIGIFNGSRFVNLAGLLVGAAMLAADFAARKQLGEGRASSAARRQLDQLISEKSAAD